MNVTARPRRLDVTADVRPILPRHVKLRFDQTRQVWILLAPERVLAPDDISVEVLQLCDGKRSVRDIAEVLATKFAAPADEIATDVAAMLQDLADKGFLDQTHEVQND